MSERPRHRAAALLFSVVPGFGHVHQGRETLGLGLFTVFAVFAFAWINGRYIYRGDGRELLVWGAGSAALVVWLWAFADLWLRTSPARVLRTKAARERFLLQGMTAYLKSDWAAAEVNFRGCLRLDPHDVEALFRLGMTLLRKAEDGNGDFRPAGRVLQKTLRFDLEDKWTWDIERVLEELRPSRARGRRSQSNSGDATESDESGDETASGEATDATPETKETAPA